MGQYKCICVIHECDIVETCDSCSVHLKGIGSYFDIPGTTLSRMQSKTSSVEAFWRQNVSRIVQHKTQLTSEAKTNANTVKFGLCSGKSGEFASQVPSFVNISPILTLRNARQPKYVGYNDSAVPPTHTCPGYMYP